VIELLENSNIALIGAGRIGKIFLEIILGPNFIDRNIRVLGVADIKEAAKGILFARDHGIFTTSDFTDFYHIKDLNIIIELTADDSVITKVRESMPKSIRVIDHYDALLLFDYLQIEETRLEHLKRLRKNLDNPGEIEETFQSFSKVLTEITKERTIHLQNIEKQLAERERMVSQIIDGSTIPTFVINRNHVVTHWNKACEGLTGYKAQQVVGTGNQWMPFRKEKRPVMADVIVDEMQESQIRKYYGTHWKKSALIEGAYEAEEYFSHFKEGGKWLFFTAAPIKTLSGKIIGAIETLWDMTERKEAQKKLETYTDKLEEMVKSATTELARQSDFQQKLIKSSYDGIIATDQGGNIIIYNIGAENIFGYSSREVIGVMTYQDLYPEDLALKVRNGLNRTEKDNFWPWTEGIIQSKSGATVPTRFSGAVLLQEEEVIGSVCFFRDLREIKRLQKELIKTERMAAIGQTIAGLAHHIKNILYGLKGGVYVLNTAMDKSDTEKIRNGWKMIERNIERIADLVHDFLTYSKERIPEPQNCHPRQIAEEICALITPRAAENGILILTEFDPLISEVYMDPKAIHRILLDLISNAVDACIFDILQEKKWVVTLSIKVEGTRTLRFDVSDNGIGMSQETMDKLFTNVFSLKGQKGTGLGLLVSAKLVHENGGTIQVKSELGKGSTFTVWLPYQEAR
jgi:PAS domain S-box-containing protein